MDRAKPRVTITSSRRDPLKLHVRSSERGRATVRLQAGSLTLASRTLTFTGPSERAIRLRLTKAAKAKLRRAGRLRARLTVVVTDTAGNARRVTKTVTLRR